VIWDWEGLSFGGKIMLKSGRMDAMGMQESAVLKSFGVHSYDNQVIQQSLSTLASFEAL
jgi:hypothetical protein